MATTRLIDGNEVVYTDCQLCGHPESRHTETVRFGVPPCSDDSCDCPGWKGKLFSREILLLNEKETLVDMIMNLVKFGRTS